jgi:hypothetical protein
MWARDLQSTAICRGKVLFLGDSGGKQRVGQRFPYFSGPLANFDQRSRWNVASLYHQARADELSRCLEIWFLPFPAAFYALPFRLIHCEA